MNLAARLVRGIARRLRRTARRLARARDASLSGAAPILRQAHLLPRDAGWRLRAKPAAVDVRRGPPHVDDPMRALASVAQRTPGREAMDLALFESLNEAYASRPLVLAAPRYDHETLVARASARAAAIHGRIDLVDRDVLVFGCGNGYEVWVLADAYRSRVTGIDITEHASWPILAGPNRRFVMADIATDRPFPAHSFDRVVSINVFEHVTHPRATLAELHRVLRPGGLAWITANLHRGPKASHRYREVFFPWPHLLFDDEVFRAFYRTRNLPELPAEWVNHMTWEQYRDEIRSLGFIIRREKLLETPIDEDLYRRFAWILERYPRADLARDFFQVVLEKPLLGRR